MIRMLLRDARPRLLALAPVALVFYFLEPGFHQHDSPGTEIPVELGARGLSATLAYLAGVAMIVLLAGFVSADRSRGYAHLFFAHRTPPLRLYASRWLLAFALALSATLLFLLLGQWLAWGEVRGGWGGLLLAALAALIYGGLMAFFSATLPRGDGWVVFLLFLPTFFPQLLTALEPAVHPALWQVLLFLLPPQGALQGVYQGLLLGTFAGGAALYAAGYGLFWLLLATLVLWLREWG